MCVYIYIYIYNTYILVAGRRTARGREAERVICRTEFFRDPLSVGPLKEMII